jgi:hypothetical protein
MKNWNISLSGKELDHSIKGFGFMIKSLTKYIVIFSILFAYNCLGDNSTRISQIRSEVTELKRQVNELKLIRGYIQQKIKEGDSQGQTTSESAPPDTPTEPIPIPYSKIHVAQLSPEEATEIRDNTSSELLLNPEEDVERQKILDQIEIIEKVSEENPDFWDIRDQDDIQRLELAKKLENPEDVSSIREKLEEENQNLDNEIAEAEKASEESGNYTELDVLKKQKEIKEKTIEELKLQEKICSFNEKDGAGQNEELFDLKEKEKSAHRKLIEENSDLREQEKEIKEKQDSFWAKIGLGGPSEEEIKEFQEQKDKTDKAQENFEELNEELLVKAANAENADEEIKNDIIDHCTKRLLAQHSTVEGKQRKLNLEEENIDKETDQNKLASAGNPVLELFLDGKSSADKELMGQDLGREEEKLLKQAATIKKASEVQQTKIAEKKNEVQEKLEQGKISESDARKQVMELDNETKNSVARMTMAELIEKERVDVASKSEQKGDYSNIKAAWNQETPNTKTSLVYKPVKLLESATGDAVTGVVDKVKNATGGAFGETKKQTVNQDIEKLNNDTSKTLRNLKEYTELNALQKEEIRQNKIFDRKIKDKNAQQVAEKLEKNYLGNAGGKGIDLLNAGHEPANKNEAMQISLAKAERNLDQTENNIKKSLKDLQVDETTGSSTSWNPIKWGTGKLTKHEIEKKAAYLEKIKKDREIVEKLKYENQYNVADEGDKKYFLNTISEGLKLKASSVKDDYKNKIRDIDQKIGKAFPGEKRDKLREQKEKLINETADNYKKYKHQGLHLEAEKEIIQDNYQAAKSKYKQIALEDPTKAKQMQAMESNLNEYVLEKKNNEMSAEMAETVITDVAMAVATGGAGKAMKGVSTTAGKFKKGFITYAKVLNPASTASDIAAGAATQFAAENTAKLTGLDKEVVSQVISTCKMIKPRFKADRIAHNASSTKPKSKFDTDIMPAVRSTFNKNNFSKKVEKKVAEIKNKISNLKPKKQPKQKTPAAYSSTLQKTELQTKTSPYPGQLVKTPTKPSDVAVNPEPKQKTKQLVASKQPAVIHSGSPAKPPSKVNNSTDEQKLIGFRIPDPRKSPQDLNKDDIAAMKSRIQVTRNQDNEIVRKADPQDTLTAMQNPQFMRELKEKGSPEMQDAIENAKSGYFYTSHDAQLTNYVKSNSLDKISNLRGISESERANIEVRVDDFRTPGQTGRSVNTDRDYRVLYRRPGSSEWMEVPKELWLDKSKEVFAEVTQAERPANWDRMSEKNQKQFFTDHYERHGQRGTDKYDIEASIDYSDQYLDPFGNKRGLNAETASQENALRSTNIENVKNGNGVLKDPEGLGLMYQQKVLNSLDGGNIAEAAAQAKKAVKSIDSVRSGYERQGYKLHQLSPKLREAMWEVDNSPSGLDANPQILNAKLRKLGFRDGLTGFAERMKSEFESLKNAKSN